MATGILFDNVTGEIDYVPGNMTIDGTAPVTSLTELSDIALNSPSNGQVLKFDGTSWINDTDIGGGSGGLSDAYTGITDGTITTVASSTDTFKFHSSDGTIGIAITDDDATHGDNADFILAAGLPNLTDVDLTGLADGDILSYNTTSSNWESGAPSGGGGGLSDAYTGITDGTITTVASSTDTFKFHSSDGTIGIAIADDDATHGDNADFILAAGLNNLTDVDLTGLADGYILSYNNTSSNWESGAPSIDPAYTGITDGTTTTVASSIDTFKFRSSDGTIGIAITDDDVTHGDNADFILAAGLTNLTDVDNALAPTTDDILKYDGASWVSAAHNVGNITDVDLTGLADGDILSYNTTSSNWESGTPGGDAYTGITDGTTTTVASSTDTFKFRSSDNTIGITITNDDATHGDNADFILAAGLTNLTDVDNALAPTTDDILKYDGASWVSAAHNVDNIVDIDLTGLADGDILSYNTTSSNWESGAPSGGGSSNLLDAEAMYAQWAPGVAAVSSEFPDASLAHGSGFFIDNTHVVTNCHVIIQDNPAIVQATNVYIGFTVSGLSYVVNANLIGYDLVADIAVLELSDLSTTALNWFIWGSSRTIGPGSEIATIGAPFGRFMNSITKGVVRDNKCSEYGFMKEAVTADYETFGGCSGGVMIDNNGAIIGMHTWVYNEVGGGESSGSSGHGNHANPSHNSSEAAYEQTGMSENEDLAGGVAEDFMQPIVTQIIADNTPGIPQKSSLLGIQFETMNMGELIAAAAMGLSISHGLNGCVVKTIFAGTPADIESIGVGSIIMTIDVGNGPQNVGPKDSDEPIGSLLHTVAPMGVITIEYLDAATAYSTTTKTFPLDMHSSFPTVYLMRSTYV